MEEMKLKTGDSPLHEYIITLEGAQIPILEAQPPKLDEGPSPEGQGVHCKGFSVD